MSRQTLWQTEYSVAQSNKDKINTIYLGQREPAVSFDWRAFCREVEMAPGCVAVEMEVPYLDYGNMVVSQVAAGRMRSDCATVLGVGEARSDRNPWEAPGLQIFPGDRVGVLPYDGKYFSQFRWGSYSSVRRVDKTDGRLVQSKVRMIGVASKYAGEHYYKDWWEVVVVKIQDKVEPGSIVTAWNERFRGRSGIVQHVECQGARVVFLEPTGEVETDLVDLDQLELHPVQPLNKWVLIKRRSVRTTADNIHLPDTQAYREQVAQVVAIGPRAENGYRCGDWVMYHGKGLILDFEFGERFGFTGDPRDYCLIHESDLHARVKPPADQ